jgi:Ca-activated chloride channel family protein
LVDQIVRLSIRYGIVTPYTSYLVTEPTALGVEAQDDIANFAFEKMKSTPMAVSGADAFERAAAEGEFRAADVPLDLEGDALDVVRIAGSRTYRLVNGVWIDTAFDPDSMSTTKVSFLSDDYFALADARSDLGAAFALGPNVIALADGVAYEVIDADFEGDPVEIPASPPEEVEDITAIEEPAPSIREEEKRSRDITLPCPGFAFTLGLVVVPWLQRKHGASQMG